MKPKKHQPIAFSLMKILRRHIKLISAFFGINFLSSVFAPNVAYALTSGPTAPEYTSFEPVDTTDMVNLATGDFVYNLPLLEVPGPAGGYPLSLSYHAGIMPDEEASWVGLGWTLNPGAINRTVNGYPDDQYDATESRRDYNKGGKRYTASIGIGVPGASFGLSLSHDTNLGFGMGSSFSVGYSLFNSSNNGAGLGISAYAGTDGYGNAYSGVGAGLMLGKAGAEAKGLALNVGVSTNFESVSFSGGVSARTNSKAVDGRVGTASSQSLVGGSLSSKGLKPSASVAGISASQHNSRANSWSTKSFGFSVPIPLGSNGLFLNIGYNYFRYSLDETSNVRVIGTLHGDQTFGKSYDDWSFDSYALTEVEVDYLEQDPEKDRGGSFPAYDSYSVMAQGLSGSIRPFYNSPGHLMRQNLKTADGSDYEVQYLSVREELPKPYFRFLNDFSNAFTYSEDARLNATSMVPIESTPEIGYLDDGRVMGSKQVEHFTNAEIASGFAKSSGLIGQTKVSSFTTNIEDQVGAYKITNETGVTYHYTQPCYAFDEFTKNQNKDDPSGIFTSYSQSQPYAYTWLLTAITGSDYVDKNNDGFANDGDWGYWVEFDYGLWTDQYKWRNPFEGYHSDLNSDYQMYSRGKKELWYLNRVSTSTHVAIFEKEIRADGKGAVDYSTGSFGFQGRIMSVEGADELGNPEITNINYNEFSASTLKLNNIYLLDKENLIDDLNELSDAYNHTFTYEGEVLNGYDYYTYDFDISVHYGNNVIDSKDLETPYDVDRTYREYLEEKSVRVISFEHSYDLQDQIGNSNGVPNSFDEDGSMYVANPSSSESSEKLGKLTLESIEFLGKAATPVTPPMSFHYDIKGEEIGGNAISVENESLILPNATGLTIGDLVKVRNTQGNVGTFYVSSISSDSDSWGINTAILKPVHDINVDDFSGSISYQETKNPPWAKNHRDIWGMYKSDYQDLGNENLSRKVTPESSQSVDAWSLTRINTSLGGTISIAYESDSYGTPALYENHIGTIESFEVSEEHEHVIELDELTYNQLEEGQEIDLLLFLRIRYTVGGGLPLNQIKMFVYEINLDVEKIGLNKLRMFDSNLLDEVVASISDPDCEGIFCFKSITGIDFAAGNLNVNKSINNLGGGLRVSDISVSGFMGDKHSSLYSYNNSGSTSFEPYGTDLIQYKIADLSEFSKEPYESKLRKTYSELLLVSREVQAPGVVYEYVTVREGVDGVLVPGKQVYNFQVFERDFVERKPIKDLPEYTAILSTECSEISEACLHLLDDIERCEEEDVGPCPALPSDCDYCFDNPGGTYEESITTYDIAPMTIRDYTARVGNLKSVKTYGTDDQLILESKTIYQYDLDREENLALESDSSSWKETNLAFKQSLTDKFGRQGATQEAFIEYRLVKKEEAGSTVSKRQRVFSKKEYYPAVVTGTKTINHKTGITKESRNLGFDFLTGDVTLAYSEDGYGSQYITKSVPAYHYYPEMLDRNMLTQEGSSYTYFMEGAFDPSSYQYDADQVIKQQAIGLVGASAQSWNALLPFQSGSNIYQPERVDGVLTRTSTSVYLLEAPQDVFAPDDIVLFHSSEETLKMRVDQWNGSAYEVSLFFLGFDFQVGSNLDGFMWTHPPIWRKHQSLSYIGEPSDTFLDDGTIDPATFEEFQPGVGISEATGWQTNSAITRYDVNSHALEAMDVNGNYAATKFDLKNERVVATAANAMYDEFAFSGAEGPVEGTTMTGGVQLEGERVEGIGHTGTFWVGSTSTNRKGFSYTISTPESDLYKASFWSGEPTSTIKYRQNGGATQTAILTNPGYSQFSDDEDSRWHLIEGSILATIAGGPLEIWTEGADSYTLHDDFRVHPMDATMTSYVYDEWGELSYILDANNLFTYYQYDDLGRLASVTRETLSDGPVKVSDVVIEYGNPILSSNLYGDIKIEKVGNTASFSIDFANEGSGDYQYLWNIDGVDHPTTDDIYPFTVTQSNGGLNKDIIVTVTDSETGLSFTQHSIESYSYCIPAGQWLGDPYCEWEEDLQTGQLCMTGNVVRQRSTGNCQTPEIVLVETGSATCQDPCADECPPNEICFETFDEN